MSLFIAHFTDPHITLPHKPFKDVDALQNVKSIVHHINNLARKPDLTIITGDLAHEGLKEEYERLKSTLSMLSMPYYLIPGNHDDRDNLRTVFFNHHYFPNPGKFLNYVINDFPVRLIGLDTMVPNQGRGELCRERIAWLDQTLSQDQSPTILFMHHPPHISATPPLNKTYMYGFHEFSDVIQKHSQIIGILCGHYHRTLFTTLCGIPLCALASTTAQIAPDFSEHSQLVWTKEPPVYAIHWLEPNNILTSSLVVVSP